MKTSAQVLTVNGGSSSIKFALFTGPKPIRRQLVGKIEGIGRSKGTFAIKAETAAASFSRSISAPNHAAAVKILMDWVAEKFSPGELAAVGHRIVHGGPKYWQPQKITPKILAALRQFSPFDPEHLPEEIKLTEAFHARFPELRQIACFDTAFHHAMPSVARLLPIPRRYAQRGVVRYGFHGLSCEFLMQELTRVAGPRAARGRVIIAHLGNGASITAVRDGRSIDTSMSFTPTAGIPMSTRSGDLDPGLVWYLTRTEKLTPKQFNHLVNHESGLLGVSGTSSDMRDLAARASSDPRAAEAVALFCYQAKKWICGFAGALGGLDTLIFSGGIGENDSRVRARICDSLDFLGLKIVSRKNADHADIISTPNSRVTVRVIRTDEESVIARHVYDSVNSKK